MTPPDITSAAFFSVKLIILIGIAVYTVFSAVIVRQEQLMANVLEEAFEPIIRVLTIIHLVAAISVFIFALFIL